jgi:hypothetical protein
VKRRAFRHGPKTDSRVRPTGGDPFAVGGYGYRKDDTVMTQKKVGLLAGYRSNPHHALSVTTGGESTRRIESYPIDLGAVGVRLLDVSRSRSVQTSR